MDSHEPNPVSWRREDLETTTVEAAAAFEQRRGESATFMAYGRRLDVDDRPSPSEL